MTSHLPPPAVEDVQWHCLYQLVHLCQAGLMRVKSASTTGTFCLSVRSLIRKGLPLVVSQ